jgi:insertion element IS1 protein InsB
MLRLVKLLGFMWGSARRREPASYGTLCERVYRQCAVAYTDFWDAYGCIFPEKRHKAVGKETGQTSYIERFNCTMRQRVSRLVRKTLSFSKKLENHIGAIWLFVHHYNSLLQNKLSLHI